MKQEEYLKAKELKSRIDQLNTYKKELDQETSDSFLSRELGFPMFFTPNHEKFARETVEAYKKLVDLEIVRLSKEFDDL